ncbi:MAG: hypothetical protein ACI30V_00710 [Muribaculaceae bacterium]
MVVLCMGCLTACNQDQEGAIYQPNNAELSFTSSALESVSVPLSNPVFNLEVFRGNVKATPQGKPSFSVTVVANGEEVELEGCTISDYQFEEGASRGYVAINVSPLVLGVEATVTVSIDDADLSVGGVQTTTFAISKDYTWISLGTGTYTDNWGWGITYNVEIQKAEGFDRWRVIDPYGQSIPNDDGEWGDWLDTTGACPYVEFWNTDDEGSVDFNAFYTGLLYGGDPSAKITAYPARAFGKVGASQWYDDSTVILCPYYYIIGVGGWDMTKKAAVIITMP